MTFDDVRVCPYCESDDTYDFSTDELEFGWDGLGHYNVDCHCNKCNKNFRLYMKFEYIVKESYTR